MDNELRPGIRGLTETVVDGSNTAKFAGSGELEVFATPNMIALMEQAAQASVAPYLKDGQGTVGTLISVSHDAATPVGMRVRAESVLTAVDRRRLCFEVSAYDECGLIGRGTHERFIIDNEKFLAKVNAKGTAK